MNFWDERFSEPGYKYGVEPNAYLKANASRLRDNGRILVPGDGEGRNGVWLAEQGHAVLSVDNSTVGLCKASELAKSRSVAIETQIADLAEWSPEPCSFDAVVLVYTHLPKAIRRRAHQALADGLKSGGLFILEAFHPEQLQFSSGGPKDVGMLYTPETLHGDLGDRVEVLESWHGELHLAEGPGHQGRAHVTRFIGRAR